MVCDRCSGTGEIIAAISRYGAPSKCPRCAGTGAIVDNMESKERIAGDIAEAEQKRKLLKSLSVDQLLHELSTRDAHGDYRIRMRSRDGKYRVTAPNANKSGGTVYINKILVIESKIKNSIGEESWHPVGERLTTQAYGRDNPPDLRDLAIFSLLSNSDHER